MNNAVVDHQGEHVPAGEADVDYTLQDLTLLATVPEDAEDVADRGVLDPSGLGANVAFEFNAYIDVASIDAADVEIRTEAGAVVASTFSVDDDGDFGTLPGVAILVKGAAAYPAGNYVARLKSGAVFTEVNGGEITLTEDVDVRFVVE
jgi:hypothetical protein